MQDEEAAAAADARAAQARLSKLEQLRGQIERAGDDRLDDCMSWVASAVQENEGKRLTLHLVSTDQSRAFSFGIKQRSKFTKLMAK
jgi:hypothetical protein|eukprot:COSAG01_NODE_123_length_25210_cov_348.799434_12_plen_86_part_00